MKVEDMPKDDANALEGKTSFIQYAVDKEGNYVQEKSPGFEPQNIALAQAWDEVKERTASALEEVIHGDKSPIYFFMCKEMMDVKILAEYMNLPRWRVKKHLKGKNFPKINSKILQEYAKVLSIDSNDLLSFEASKWR